MKRRLIALSFAACLALPGAAFADKLDFNAVKCEDWLKSPKESIAITLAWLDGYYKDEDDDAILDFDELGKNAEKLATACARNLDKTLGQVAEELFGK